MGKGAFYPTGGNFLPRKKPQRGTVENGGKKCCNTNKVKQKFTPTKKTKKKKCALFENLAWGKKKNRKKGGNQNLGKK